MKKILFSGWMALLCCSALTSVQAQKIELGGGVFFATDEALDLGIDLRGAYKFNEEWRANLSVGIFFPQTDQVSFSGLASTTTISTTVNAFAFTLEGNYIFPLKGSKALPYLLAGVNLVTASAKVTSSNTFFTGDLEAGGNDSGVSFNFGVGLDLALARTRPFFEFKYSAGEADYGVLVGGLRFQF